MNRARSANSNAVAFARAAAYGNNSQNCSNGPLNNGFAVFAEICLILLWTMIDLEVVLLRALDGYGAQFFEP
jgi:hypothetical protein